MKIKFVISVFILTIFTTPLTTRAQLNSESERIEGVAQFLLERVNYNYVYLFEHRLKKNTYFQCYFPITFDYASSGHLLTLLRSGEEVWSSSIQQDIDNFLERAIAQLIRQPLVKTKPLVVDFISQYNELMQDFDIKIDEVIYPLSSIPIDAPQKVKETINDFYLLADALNELIKKQNELEKSALDTNKVFECIDNNATAGAMTIDNDTIENFKQLSNTLATNIRDQLKIFDQYKNQLQPNAKAKTKAKEILLSKISKFLAIDSKIAKLSDYYNSAEAKLATIKSLKSGENSGNNNNSTISTSAKTNNVIKVLEVEKLIKQGIDAGTFPGFKDFDLSKYNRFKQYIVFFAEVSEAKRADQVKALLEEITLPPVSFGRKRTPGEPQWLITSYVGVASYWEDTVDQGYKEVGGVFAPIGIEYTFLRSHGHSYSAMLAPFDFAHPINLEIEDQDEAVKLGDIVIPGAYLSWGYKDLPLTVGLGYNKGRALRTDSKDEDRYMIFFAFDLPLFTLF